MKILLSGGGTMGSVSPLIATYQEIKRISPETEFLFIGTSDGPEKEAILSYKIPFRSIVAGKWRRYFDLRNLIDPFKVIWGFIQAFFVLGKFRPNAVMVAGAFVGVPVAWAAWVRRIPVLIHQQDIIPGLANKLMANIATRISVSFEISLKDFFPDKTVLTGNAVRREFYDCEQKTSGQFFNLRSDLPILLILGGGTGAVKINGIVEKSLADLLQFCQIIHITGKGKKIEVEADGYHQFEFLSSGMTEAMCSADLIVSRGGLSTASECIIMAKPTVIIPMAKTHQEFNAQYFQKFNAVFVLAEESLTPEMFISVIRDLMYDEAQRQNLSRNIAKVMPHDGAAQIAKLLLQIAK